MTTHLRMDHDTGAIFAANRITEAEAVISVISTCRRDPARAERAAGFLGEWLAQLPASVKRISTWASDEGATAFLREHGFADEPGYVTPQGGRGMAIIRH